jgi:ABC-2 type transport system ATP-binding protein
MEPLLQVKDLTKHYSAFTLDRVNFSLPRGSIMGFIGENGAGKTTTIKLILNLIKKDGGEIRVFGQDNIQNERQIKEKLGVVLDESSFHDNLKPMEISSIMRNIFKGWDNEKYVGYLKRFKLPTDKRIKEYSKGMKTKLSIAAALAHDPMLLILDEATSGLDPIVRNEILDIFMEFIQDEEHSVLMSTHITSDLERIADYITFIHEGRIVFTSSKDDIIYNYGVLKCGAEDFAKIPPSDIAGYRKGQFGYEALVKDRGKMHASLRQCTIDNASIEDIMLFHIRSDKK